MKVLLKSDGKTVLFKDGQDSGTINVNDDMWQLLDVETETPLIDGRESLWVVFQNKEDSLFVTNELLAGRDDDGHHRVLIPNDVIALPGVWTFQLLTKTYDNVSDKWVKRVGSNVCMFVVENGLPVSPDNIVTNTTIAELYNTAQEKIAKETQNAEDIQTANAKIDANATAIEENATQINTVEGDVAETKEKLSTLTSDVAGLRGSVATVFNEVVASISLVLDDEYKLTLVAIAKDGEILGLPQTVDFPVESMVVDGEFDADNKKIVLTLQNGNTVEIPVGSLVDGLISTAEKGQANGVATLGSDGKVPAEQLPEMSGGGGGSADLSEYVKFTDYATGAKAGVVKSDSSYYGFLVNSASGIPYLKVFKLDEYKNTYANSFISKGTLENIKSTYVKEGITTNTETLTDEAKASACDWLGAVAKIATSSTHQQVYAKSASGTQKMLDVSYSNDAREQGIVIRDNKGAIYIPDASIGSVHNFEKGKEAVNKDYVDENKGTKLYKHSIFQEMSMDWTIEHTIISTRSNKYTTRGEVYTDYKNGNIIRFLGGVYNNNVVNFMDDGYLCECNGPLVEKTVVLPETFSAEEPVEL